MIDFLVVIYDKTLNQSYKLHLCVIVMEFVVVSW